MASGMSPDKIDEMCEKHGWTKPSPAASGSDSQSGGRRRRRRSTKKGMKRKTARLAYTKRRGKGGSRRRRHSTKKGMKRKTARLAYSKRHGVGGKRRRCPKYCRRKTLRCKSYGRRRY